MNAVRILSIKISKRGPAISNLLFADDSLLFCKANAGEAKEIMRIIQSYGKASG